MNSSPNTAFERRPLLVLALGGNALSPANVAASPDASYYAAERATVGKTGKTLNKLIAGGYRLLLVHGNGPQVGRLMRHDPEFGSLDIHTAQTQGELGYLLLDAINAPTACLLTRVIVEADLGPSVKPIGPILRHPPATTTATQVKQGWRVTVPSPKPVRVVENEVIAALSRSYHVIAGGGGGIPITSAGERVNGVVDKDWVASLLAISLGAEKLLFATDVDHVYENFGEANATPLKKLNSRQAKALIETGVAKPGSMAPKIGGAMEFASTTGQPAYICSLADIEAAARGQAGTRVE